ncbi:MAG: threonine-phosphate decarboxylase CobD [Planctomycetota bacterium]
MTTERPHRHGGAPELEFARLGLRQRPVIDFSVNTSPLGPPPEVTGAWNDLAAGIERYPSVQGDGIVRYYRERLGLAAESILAGNGSTELIYLIPRALGLGRVEVASPSFHDYARASELAGARVSYFELSEETGFAFPGVEAMREALKRADALFVGSPNNPTGTVFPPEALLELAGEHPGKWILVDEAFVQFLNEYPDATLARPDRLRPNVLVLQSLTKFYALAGLRLGCVIGHPETVARLRTYKEPWTVNGVAEAVAGLLAGRREYDEKLRRLIRSERGKVVARLRGIAGVEAFAPSANFVLARWTATDELDDLLRSLLEGGLYVRDCRNFPGLERGYFRFAVRGPEENERLLSSIERIAGGNRA